MGKKAQDRRKLQTNQRKCSQLGQVLLVEELFHRLFEMLTQGPKIPHFH
jgi:hypothetical protein